MGVLLVVLALWVAVGITEGAVVVWALHLLGWLWSVDPMTMTLLYAGAVCGLVAVLFSGRVFTVSRPPVELPQERVRVRYGLVPPDDDDPDRAQPSAPALASNAQASVEEAPVAPVIPIERRRVA